MLRSVNWLLSLLAVVCVVAWITSYILPMSEARNAWRISDGPSERTIRFSLSDGRLRLKYGEACTLPVTPTRGWSFFGTTYAVVEFSGATGGYRVYMIGIHLLILVVLLAACPVVAVIRGPIRRDWRKRHGRCENCGYDLTGNVSGACSECGVSHSDSRSPPSPRPS